MTAYWFKPKRYGYGATPITWEGWAVTLGTVIAMVVVSVCLRLTERHSWALAAVFAFDAAALSHFSSLFAARPTASGAGGGAAASRWIGLLEFLGMALLEIKNLHVEIDGKEILKGLDLTVNAGEVHAIMGPNGSGKSTLAYVLAGKSGYEPTSGEVLFNGKNIFDMSPDERAAAGLFLAFQYPLEIPGVATMTFLRTALNAQRKKRGEAELSTPEFIKRVRETAGKLDIDQDMLRRAVNVGFSGGEKKRNEILQMALLEPRLAVLDETDSGLDIDALKIVADGVNRLRSPQRSFVVITHYQRLLSYIVPDIVHVLSAGRIVKTGGKELALELEARGYAEYQEEVVA